MNELVKVWFKKGTNIIALFRDGKIKQYDCLSLASTYPILNNLKDRKLFLKGKVCGLAGIEWNDQIDLDADEIYYEGKDCSINEDVILYLLGYELKNARLSKNYSQEYLSKLSKVDQGDISNIELGKGNPTILTLSKLSKALGKTIKLELKNL